MADRLLTVYDPLYAPARTLASARSSLQSPPGSGIFPSISNLRWGDDGILTVRSGTSKLTSAPIQTSDSGTSTGSNTTSTLRDTGKSWTTNIFAGAAVIIDGGTGSGQTSFIVSNTATILTVSPVWTTTPDATSTYKIAAEPRGFKAVTWQGLNGKLLLAAKDWVTYKTSVYLTGDPTSFGTTITPSSGRYGDTRFASDGSGHDYPIRFAILSDRFTGKDVLVMENGYDNPRVYTNQDTGTSTGGNTASTLNDTGKAWTTNAYRGLYVTITSGLGSGQTALIASNTATVLTISTTWTTTPDSTSKYEVWSCAINRAISQPAPKQLCVSRIKANGSMALAEGSPTKTGTGTNWDWTTVGSGTSCYWLIASTATTGLSGAIYYTAGTPIIFITDPAHLIVTVQASTAMINDWLANFKIEVYGTATAAWYTVHDPLASAAFGSTPLQVLGDLTLAITHVLFPLDYLTVTAETTIERLRLTPIGSSAPALGANLSMKIYGVNASGPWPGATNWKVGDVNSASKAEGPGLKLLKGSRPLSYDGMSTALGTAQWPLSDQISYNVDLESSQQTQADADLGVDIRRAYAQLTGEENPYTGEPMYSYVQSFTIATWSGAAWTRASALGNTGLYRQAITAIPTARLLWLPSPDDFIQPIPIAKSAIVGAASRLLVGARHEAQDSFPRAAVGEGGNGLCFRFASAPNLDNPVTSYEDRIPTENIQAFTPSAASTFASPTIYAFTDSSVFLADVSLIGTPAFLRRISSNGLLAADSVAEYAGTIYYLDTNLRVQRLGGYKSDPISLGLIDDKLNGIPNTRSMRAAGFYSKDRFYLPYTPSGGTRNTRILVWSERAQGWESDDALPAPMSAEFVVIQRDGNIGTYQAIAAPKVLMLSQDMNIYQFETGTTDLTANIAIALTTGELQGSVVDGYQRTIAYDKIHFLTDAVAATLTVTYTYKIDGGTGTISVILSNSSAFDWVVSAKPTVQAGKQGTGVAGSIGITGTIAGATRIFGIRAEVIESDRVARTSA